MSRSDISLTGESIAQFGVSSFTDIILTIGICPATNCFKMELIRRPHHGAAKGFVSL